VPLAQQQVGAVLIDYCPHCSGLFFDAGELERLEGRSPRLHMSRKPPTEETPLCVRCGTKMEPYGYGGRRPASPAGRHWLEIDYCPHCQSYWLDGGEFHALRALLAKEESGHVRVDDVSAGQYLLMLLTSMPLEYNVAPRRIPWMTIALITANVLIYLASTLACAFDSGPERVNAAMGLVPRLLHPSTAMMLLTYQFAHGGILHLASNMYFLHVFGDNLEDRWGRGIYLVVYLLIGALSGLAHAVLTSAPSAPLVGASGAISGLLGAYLVTFPRARVGVVMMFVPLRVSVLAYMLIWFGIQLLGLLAERLFGTSFPVSVAAHASGFACGIAAGLLLRRRGSASRAPA